MLASPALGAFASGARIVHVLVLGLWMGAVGLYWLVQGRVGSVVDSAHVADLLLRDLLARIDLAALVAGPLLLVTLIVGWAPIQVPIRNRAVGVVVATLLAGVSGRWLAPRRAELIAALGRRLEDAEASSPLLVEIVQLAQIDLGLTTAHGLLAALLVVAAMRASQPRRRFGIEL